MFKIRRKQKQKLFKIGISVLCLFAFAVSAYSIPALAAMLPEKLCGIIVAGVMQDEYGKLMSEFTHRYTRSESDTLCVPVSLSSVLGYDYEQETSPAIPDGVELVGVKDLCGYDEEPTLLIGNSTKYSVNPADILAQKPDFDFNTEDKAPTVLILHTHGTEAYLPDNINYYTPETTFRSIDPSETVVAVGEVIADTLNAAGIITLHDTTMYDAEDFNAAYTNSRNAAKIWLEKYPTIKCIIDVHRDAIVSADNLNIKPIVEIYGKPAAQIMFVIGTDYAGAVHPDWRENLSFAACVQQQANYMYPRLFRPLNLREASFNQQLVSGAVLLEVGSCANTITEAKYSAVMFARAFAETYSTAAIP